MKSCPVVLRAGVVSILSVSFLVLAAESDYEPGATSTASLWSNDSGLEVAEALSRTFRPHRCPKLLLKPGEIMYIKGRRNYGRSRHDAKKYCRMICLRGSRPKRVAKDVVKCIPPPKPSSCHGIKKLKLGQTISRANGGFVFKGKTFCHISCPPKAKLILRKTTAFCKPRVVSVGCNKTCNNKTLVCKKGQGSCKGTRKNGSKFCAGDVCCGKGERFTDNKCRPRCKSLKLTAGKSAWARPGGKYILKGYDTTVYCGLTCISSKPFRFSGDKFTCIKKSDLVLDKTCKATLLRNGLYMSFERKFYTSVSCKCKSQQVRVTGNIVTCETSAAFY